MSELIQFTVEHYQSALACFGGSLAFLFLIGGIFGSGDTASTATETDQAVTDEGVLKTAGASLAESGSVQLTGKAKLQTGGIGGSVGAGAKLGTTEFSNSPVTITDSSPEVLVAALDRISDLSSQSTQSLADFASKAEQGQASQLATLLEALSTSKEKADPEAKQNRTVLFIVLGLLALLGFVFRKKLF